MRPAALIWLLFLLPFVVAAQQQDRPYTADRFFLKHGVLGFEGGLSVPIKDYGTKDITSASGYANTGYALRLHLSYEAFPLLGVRLQYLYNRNGFDGDAYMEDLRVAVANTPGSDIRPDRYTSDAWVLHGLMAGIFIPLRSTKTTYAIGASVGFLSTTFPSSQLDYHIISSNRDVKLHYDEGSSNDLGYSVYASIRKQLYKDLLITGQVEFLYSEQEFKDLTATDLISGTRFQVEDYKQYFQILNFSAGLAWQFD